MSSSWPPHVTVAVVVEHDGKFLMVQERTADGLRLNQPAGHLEPHETPLQGALREAREETGMELSITDFLGVYLARAPGKQPNEWLTYLRLAYIARCATDQLSNQLSPQLSPQQQQEGIVAVLWLTPEAIQSRAAEHRSPLVWACVADYLRGKRLPLDSVLSDPSLTAQR